MCRCGADRRANCTQDSHKMSGSWLGCIIFIERERIHVSLLIDTYNELFAVHEKLKRHNGTLELLIGGEC